MTELVKRQNGDKQIGCISGFFQIFDRHQILAGKRIHSTKRLPPPTSVGASPEFSGEQRKPERTKHVVVMPASTVRSQPTPSENAAVHRSERPEKSTPLIPMSEINDGIKKSSWKSNKETPRSSLDSNANSKPLVTNGDDNKQRRSPSVIAKLMGLEPLSTSGHESQHSGAGKPALRRSVSEPRLSRDLFHSKYIDGNNFQVKQPYIDGNNFQVKQPKQTVENTVRDEGRNLRNKESVNVKSESQRTSPWRSQRKSFFDSADFFPEPNQTTSSSSMHGDFEKKLKMRGTDEQSDDLGTLKQILEVLQLKGLLHSTTTRTSNRDRNRNFVYVRNLPSDESSIVLMKPWRSTASKVDNQRSVNESRGIRRYSGENSPAISPKREGGRDRSSRSPARGRNSSPTRIESNLKSCNSIVKRKPLSIEIQRRANESSDSVKTSPINSPKLTPKRTGSAHPSLNNRSQRNQKPSESSAIYSTKQKNFKNIVTEDESSSISETMACTPTPTETEGNRHGRSLLQRCDKLLHNISEMNTTESPPISATVLPSPVSVLDSGFDKDEASSPSHSIEFKEDESYSRSITPANSTEHEEFISNDSDFIYISEILRVSPYLQHEDQTVFSSIEKHLHKSNNTSNINKNQRKLIFDVIVEILDRNRQLPPWKAGSGSATSLKQIWSEFQKIRVVNTGDGMLDLISGVLKKDLIEISGWIDHPVERSEAILDIERMIFKDLVNEAICDLVEFPAKCVFSRPQRKLVF